MEVLLDTCGRRRVKSLLLLYLFVVKAAADCPKPVGTENIALTEESLLLNNFPEGSQVTWECANGYVIDSGSGSVTCVDNKWTEPDLICKKKDCGPPKPQPNMSFNLSHGTLFGAVVKVTCAKGFQIIGTSFKRCFATGWSGRAKCEIVTCDKPANVTNGRNSWDSQDDPKYGETISYVCNEGYTLVGKDFIMCSETGQYDSQAPTCEVGGTTEGTVTTTMATPAPTSPTQEISTSTDSSATPTAHRDKTVATATQTVSPSLQGGRDTLTTEGKASTTTVASTTSSPFQDKHDGAIDTNEDVGYTPVIVSVVCVSLAVCVLAVFVHKFLLKRKGSSNGTVPIY